MYVYIYVYIAIIILKARRARLCSHHNHLAIVPLLNVSPLLTWTKIEQLQPTLKDIKLEVNQTSFDPYLQQIRNTDETAPRPRRPRNRFPWIRFLSVFGGLSDTLIYVEML
ncbi:hypothetical protein ElyMa_005383100 [Elysia marginata]|uniref:Uncharacterized protein n=1 Tax=Elysia marginata TaxID=1093978 RepID=A0AAV4EG83_9GAST|nr:hypothetical protein ElyMa_005383100 [Elysia marginata]